MSKRALVFLVILVTVLISVAKLKSDKTKSVRNSIKTELIKINVEDIKNINIVQSKEKVSLVKKDDHWVVDTLHQYKADRKKISSLLLNILTLSSSQFVTSNKDNYSYLGFSEQDKVSISFKDNNKILGGIDLGKERESKNSKAAYLGRYIKGFNSDDVYIIAKEIDVMLDSSEWIEKNICKISKLSVEKIVFLTTKPKLIIVPENADIKDGKEPKFILKGFLEKDQPKDWMVNQIIGNLTELNTESVIPKNNDLVSGLNFHKLLQLQVKNGSVYHFYGAEQDDKFYLQIKLVLSEKVKTPISKDVTLLQESFDKWIYIMESFSSSTFKKKYVDLVDVKEEKQDDLKQESAEKKIENISLQNKDAAEDELQTVEPSL